MAAAKPSRTRIDYALEQLFVDQDPSFVIDCIAPVLAWVPGKGAAKSQPPFEFPLDQVQVVGGKINYLTLALSWDLAALSGREPGVAAHAARLASKTSPQREHVTELAAYGLSLVAISALFPERRIVGFNRGAAPDILFDSTPNALRGVEVAGRSSGGKNALVTVSADKRPALIARMDIAEAHLSVWCASARHSIFERIT